MEPIAAPDTLWTQRKGRRAPSHDGAPDVEDEATTNSDKSLRCRHCDQSIGDSANIGPIHGDSATRVFSNPYGILYELVTTTHTHDVVAVGTPSTDFPWFAGYAWQIAYCASCGTHLGWLFSATANATPSAFWGLLTRAIAEGD